MKINLRKSEELRVSAKTDRRIKMGEKSVDQVQKFLYLGSHIANGGGEQTDVEERIPKDSVAFCKL